MQIGIAGNIGAGKSTLGKRLANHFGLPLFREEFEDSPILAAFYNDFEAWGFTFQNYVINQRFGDHVVSRSTGGVLDRTYWENDIFFETLYRTGKLPKSDYQKLRERFDGLAKSLPEPDAILFLKAAPEELLKRTKERGREAEEGISLEYLENLNKLYDQFAQRPEVRNKIQIIDVGNCSADEVFDNALKLLK